MRVGREVAARVVAHEQHRALLGDVLEAANLGAEVEARQHPQPRQRLADVVGIALVEVGRRHAPLGLLPRSPRSAARPSGRARRAWQATARRSAVRRSVGGRGAHGDRSGRSSHGALEVGPARRRPGRAADPVRLAGRQAAEQLPDRRAPRAAPRPSRAAVSITCWRRSVFIQLRPIAAWSSAVGSMITTSVPKRRTLRSSRSSRPREARRVSEGMKSSGAVHGPCREAGEPAALPLSLGAARERVEADHEVEPATGHEVHVRDGADAAVHVAPAADLHRAVEARDRARGRDGVADVRARGAEPAERGAAAGLVVARDRPVVRVLDPVAGHRARVTTSLSESVETNPRRHPAGDHLERRVAQRVRERGEGHPERARADRGQAAMEPEAGARGAIRVGGGTAVRADEAVEDLAARVGDHEPGRHACRDERADHRARRGADDLIRAARVPVGLVARARSARRRATRRQARHRRRAPTPLSLGRASPRSEGSKRRTRTDPLPYPG